MIHVGRLRGRDCAVDIAARHADPPGLDAVHKFGKKCRTLSKSFSRSRFA